MQEPAPPILIGGQAEVAIRRAARLGDGYLISTTETFENVAKRISTYRTERRERGLGDVAPVLNRIVCVVDDRTARTQAIEFFGRALLALYDGWGHGNVTTLGSKERAPERIAGDHCVIGEPSECIERLEAYSDLGIGHVACLMNFGGPGPEIVDRSIRLFGERVLPRFG